MRKGHEDFFFFFSHFKFFFLSSTRFLPKEISLSLWPQAPKGPFLPP